MDLDGVAYGKQEERMPPLARESRVRHTRSRHIRTLRSFTKKELKIHERQEERMPLAREPRVRHTHSRHL